MYKLRVESGGDSGRVFALRQGENQVGRSHEATCLITDKLVSRLHCVVTIEGDQAILENRSGNGTLLDGVAVEGRVPLRDKQRIRLGRSQTELSVVVVREERGDTDSGEDEWLSGFPTPRLPRSVPAAGRGEGLRPVPPGEEREEGLASGVILSMGGLPPSPEPIASSLPPPKTPPPEVRRGEESRPVPDSVFPDEADQQSAGDVAGPDDDPHSSFLKREDFDKAIADKPDEDGPPTRPDVERAVVALRSQEWRRYRLRQLLICLCLLAILAALSAVIVGLTS